MVGSVICFSTMDLIVKYLNEVPFGQVLFMRFFFGMIPIFFLIPRDKIFTFYKTKRPGLHAFRAVSGTIAIIALFVGLRNLPLADVISLTFTGPLFVTIMSVIFLSENLQHSVRPLNNQSPTNHINRFALTLWFNHTYKSP